MIKITEADGIVIECSDAAEATEFLYLKKIATIAHERVVKTVMKKPSQQPRKQRMIDWTTTTARIKKLVKSGMSVNKATHQCIGYNCGPDIKITLKKHGFDVTPYMRS